MATPRFNGASWGDDHRIVFARGIGGLLEVPSEGGSASELTTTEQRKELSHRLPHVLPGGDGVLFTVVHNRFPRWDEAQIWLHSRKAGVSRLLIDGGADARYASSGHLIYAREGTLLAVRFDLKRFEVIGGPIGVLPDVMQAAYGVPQLNDTGVMQLAIAPTGTLIYIAGGIRTATERSVVQVNRTGRGEPLPIVPQPFQTMRLSPDGTHLALSTVGQDRGIWLYDFTRGTLRRLAAAGRALAPVWTPNGERITYAASAGGPDSLYSIRGDASGSSQLLVASPNSLVPGGWSPNGRHLLYYELPSEGGYTLRTQDVEKGESIFIAGAPYGGGGADVSPDGRWVAYHSTESGGSQVLVDAYPGPGPRHPVSTDGGLSPVWRADGKELFYVRPGTGGNISMMTVSVSTEPTFTLGVPRQLFAGPYSFNTPARGYDVSRDGQRFLLLQPRERSAEVIFGADGCSKLGGRAEAARPRPVAGKRS